LIGLNIGSVLL